MQLTTTHNSLTTKHVFMQPQLEKIAALGLMLLIAILGIGGLIYWFISDLINPYGK